MIETFDVFLATLRAGYSLHQSLMMLADISPDSQRIHFAAFRTDVDSGVRIDVALNRLRDNLGPESRAFVGLVSSALRLGIPTESLIEHIRSEARFAHRHHSEMLARQLPVRAALPLVLCTLPSFIVSIIVPIVAGTLAELHLNGAAP